MSASVDQGNTHDAMRNQERDRRPLLLGERQELRGELTAYVAVERDDSSRPRSRKGPKTTATDLREALRALQLVRSADVPAPQPPWFPAPHSP